MKDIKVTDSVKYIGVDDHDIDLFESQYVVPNGVSYNSYVILDEKVAVMDTVDARKTDEWLVNLEEALNGRNVDYIVVSHMEPDHAASLQVLAEKYPEAKVVGNAKTFNMIPQFFTFDLEGRKVVVKEGDTLGGILKNVSMSFEELAKVNRILYNLIVPAGTILLIPGKKEEK